MSTQQSTTAFNSQTTVALTQNPFVSNSSSANMSTNVIDFSSCSFKPIYNNVGYSLKTIYPGLNVKFSCTHCNREFYGNYHFGEFPLFGFSCRPKCGCFYYDQAVTNYVGFSFMLCMWKLTTENSVWRIIVGDTNREYYDKFIVPDTDAETDEDIKIRVCDLTSFESEVKDDESCYVNGVLMTKEEARVVITPSTPAAPNSSEHGDSMIPEVLNPNPSAF